MFGKTRERTAPSAADDGMTIDDFFGDEEAAAEAARVDQLRQRVEQVEQQISSQFTSMAAYAQIAQEQIELVRSEAHHATERSERRVVGLIERERSDRLAESGGGADVAAGSAVGERLDALDAAIVELRAGLQQCLANQKALADAIIDLFQPTGDAAAPVLAPPPAAAPAAPEPSPPVEGTDAADAAGAPHGAHGSTTPLPRFPVMPSPLGSPSPIPPPASPSDAPPTPAEARDADADHASPAGIERPTADVPFGADPDHAEDDADEHDVDDTSASTDAEAEADVPGGSTTDGTVTAARAADDTATDDDVTAHDVTDDGTATEPDAEAVTAAEPSLHLRPIVLDRDDDEGRTVGPIAGLALD